MNIKITKCVAGCAVTTLMLIAAGCESVHQQAVTEIPVHLQTAPPAELPSAAERDDRYLILVNAANPVTEESVAGLEIVSAYGVVQTIDNNISLEKTTLDAVAQMFEAAKAAGIDNLFVNDGYRSYQTQQELYDGAADKTFVQLPGCSEHETGLAADIDAAGVSGRNMEKSSEGRWLAENSWKYGLILRYEKGKEALTGISYEPWHFRYVGKAAAEYMYYNGLCLEEFTAKLKQQPGENGY